MAGEIIQYLPTRADAQVAKNFLEPGEMEALNRITVAFLKFAGAMAKNDRPMHMDDWIAKLDDFLKLGEHPLLVSAGKVQAKAAEKKVNAEHDAWHVRAINAPGAMARHFVEAISKAKAIESARPTPQKERKG